jgi:hypothetical protein
MNQLQTVLDALHAAATRLRTHADDPHSSIDFDESIDKRATEAIAIIKQMMQAEPVAWALEEDDGNVYDCVSATVHAGTGI